MSPKLTGSGDFPARIIRGKFGDDLAEDLKRSPALRALLAGLCIAIVVLLASMGAVYTWITVTGQRELREEMARVRQDEQRREDVLRAELQTWRSLLRSDLDYLVETLEASGVDVPPLNADTRPAFDAAVLAAEKVHGAQLGGN